MEANSEVMAAYDKIENALMDSMFFNQQEVHIELSHLFTLPVFDMPTPVKLVLSGQVNTSTCIWIKVDKQWQARLCTSDALTDYAIEAHSHLFPEMNDLVLAMKQAIVKQKDSLLFNAIQNILNDMSGSDGAIAKHFATFINNHKQLYHLDDWSLSHQDDLMLPERVPNYHSVQKVSISLDPKHEAVANIFGEQNTATHSFDMVFQLPFDVAYLSDNGTLRKPSNDFERAILKVGSALLQNKFKKHHSLLPLVAATIEPFQFVIVKAVRIDDQVILIHNCVGYDWNDLDLTGNHALVSCYHNDIRYFIPFTQYCEEHNIDLHKHDVEVFDVAGL